MADTIERAAVALYENGQGDIRPWIEATGRSQQIARDRVDELVEILAPRIAELVAQRAFAAA